LGTAPNVSKTSPRCPQDVHKMSPRCPQDSQSPPPHAPDRSNPRLPVSPPPPTPDSSMTRLFYTFTTYVRQLKPTTPSYPSPTSTRHPKPNAPISPPSLPYSQQVKSKFHSYPPHPHLYQTALTPFAQVSCPRITTYTHQLEARIQARIQPTQSAPTCFS